MDNLPIEYPRPERCDDTPDWTPATIQRHFDWWLVHRATETEPCPICLIQKLTAENATLKGEVERLMANKWLFIPEEDVCKKCSGIGRRAYSSTATWRGGIGGQAITEDVCDSCWGTGRIDRKGFDIRKFGAEMKALRTRLDALVTAGENIGEWMPILMARWQEMGNTELPRNMREAHVAKALVAMSRKVNDLAAAVQQAREIGKKEQE